MMTERRLLLHAPPDVEAQAPRVLHSGSLHANDLGKLTLSADVKTLAEQCLANARAKLGSMARP